jgi:hypothetical protein
MAGGLMMGFRPAFAGRHTHPVLLLSVLIAPGRRGASQSWDGSGEAKPFFPPRT